MKFKNYCLVALSNTDEIKLEIEKISESSVQMLNATGIVIATFTSGLEPAELEDWFKFNKRSFLIFELNKETSGFFIDKPNIHDGLFSFLDKMTPSELQNKTDRFINDVVKPPVTDAIVISGEKNTSIDFEYNLTEEEIRSMCSKDKNEIVNNILDKYSSIGFDKMSESNKMMLELLNQ